MDSPKKVRKKSQDWQEIHSYKVGFLQQERLVNVVWDTTVYVYNPTVQSRLVTTRTSS